jgi:hypothetical protein
VFLEDLPDSGGGDPGAQGSDFAVDPAVPPQEFSRARRRTRARIERTVGGRPRRVGVQAPAWRRLSRPRCQRKIVSGRTSSSCRSLSLGRSWRGAARTARSVSVNAACRPGVAGPAAGAAAPGSQRPSLCWSSATSGRA